ncbi:MAG: type II secretion system F family protein [Candidatus Micrarchaeota archaeon]|nr:type II secretion system F family protein [Candidatus Micrarchaeota archaeon]
MKVNVPLLLMPQQLAKVLAQPFYRASTNFVKKNKSLAKDMYKLESDISAETYMSIVMMNIIFYAIVSWVLAFMVLGKTSISPPAGALLAAAFVAMMVFGFSMIYPKWLINKKVREIDRELLFAARHLRVQTSAGVSLFNALVSASSGYGAVSEEFEKIVAKVHGGVNMVDALDESATKNPSRYYNKIVWQLSNAIRAGTDVGPVLVEIVDLFMEDQRIQMKEYGAQLNTLAIIYLLLCIIVPTLSLVFILVMSSFVDIPVTNEVLAIVLGGVIFVQYMFIGLIGSRRPAVSL